MALFGINLTGASNKITEAANKLLGKKGFLGIGTGSAAIRKVTDQAQRESAQASLSGLLKWEKIKNFFMKNWIFIAIAAVGYFVFFRKGKFNPFKRVSSRRYASLAKARRAKAAKRRKR